MKHHNLNDGDRSPAWDLACELAADTRKQHHEDDIAQDARELQAIKNAARAIGLASAAAATPAQRTKRARAGGKASAKALTPKQRRERASKAGVARWAKSKGEMKHHDGT
jgi:hypothetical protein